MTEPKDTLRAALRPQPEGQEQIAVCHCGHEREGHSYYPTGGIFTNCRECECVAYEPKPSALREANSQPEGKEQTDVE